MESFNNITDLNYFINFRESCPKQTLYCLPLIYSNTDYLLLLDVYPLLTSFSSAQLPEFELTQFFYHHRNGLGPLYPFDQPY